MTPVGDYLEDDATASGVVTKAIYAGKMTQVCPRYLCRDCASASTATVGSDRQRVESRGAANGEPDVHSGVLLPLRPVRVNRARTANRPLSDAHVRHRPCGGTCTSSVDDWVDVGRAPVGVDDKSILYRTSDDEYLVKHIR